jgi:eukaryotic-like serine/threonine-protein kinase
MFDADLFKDTGYRLDEPIEADGWGRLFRATYLPHGREALLRAFPPGVKSDEGAWELLVAEIQAWARLDHPGILQALDWGAQGDNGYVATEMPAGRPLASLLNEDDGVDGGSDIFASLLVSIEAARQWGVLHLGLGPSNIWVSDNLTVQVGEYGFWYVSREFPALAVETGPFKAPEQGTGGRASGASDVYSLGAIYVALRFGTGAARTAAGGSGLPEGLGDLEPVIARCLDPQPLVRYRSAGELADALGMSPSQWLYQEYRDCPLCRLKEEIQREAAAGAWSVPYASGRQPLQAADWVRYAWIAIAAMAFAAALVWWLALR